MAGTEMIELADIERLARSESPDLAQAVAAFLNQPDPPLQTPVPQGALTVQSVVGQLVTKTRYVSKRERGEKKRELVTRFLQQTEPPPPPRVKLADLLVELYEKDSDAARAAVMEIVRVAPFKFGLWAGVKRVYKLAEARHDAQVFGAIAAAVDVEYSRPRSNEVSRGTLLYLRRRAWRFLRLMGAGTPELYPQFAVEVLRRYPEGTTFYGTWIAPHVWAHETHRYSTRDFGQPVPADLVKHRAFTDTWKQSADPLMYLLETSQADAPARFAIQSLRKDFPDKLRNVTPAWLARLAHRPIAGVHEFLVETLQSSPEFHQGKLRSIGLHETALALLLSPSDKARAYAIEYARAHATDLEPARLADLLERAPNDTKAMAAAMLQARAPRELGHVFLGRLLPLRETSAWATKQLNEAFDRKEIPESFLIDMYFGDNAQRGWASNYLNSKYQPGEIGPAYWIKVLDDPRAKDNYYAREAALTVLGKFPASAIGATWLLDALTRENMGQTVAQWLRKADSLPGLDIERLKGFVFNPSYRQVALEVLGKGKLVKPRELGFPWLLALARRPDPSLHEFAHRYLLEHMRAEDFADNGDKQAGITRLFALAFGEKEPEPVRAFAQTYLRCHHPGIGPEQPESKQLGLRPHLPRTAYTADRIWPALFDPRGDVRRFAVAITRAELRNWGYHTRVYELAESEAKEVRNVAYDALLKAGEEGADPLLALKVEELDPARVFAMTESRRRTTRDVGMELIRKHYARLGGPERLAWLMESSDREVRQFAVRLLWEKHRPLNLPPGWKPRGGKHAVAAAPAPTTPFENVDALRDFLRRILFGMPPGRSMEQRDDAPVKRRIAASVAKRNVIEVVRDLGLEDPAFARLVAPVLEEFTGSIAKGEWQACLAALVQLRAAHPGVQLPGA